MWARSIAANAAGSPPKHRTAASFRRKYDRGVPWVFCGACANHHRHHPRVLRRVVASGGPEGEARRRSPKAKPEGEARRRSPKAKPEGEARRRSPTEKQVNFISAELTRPTPTKTENNAQRTPSGGGTRVTPQTNAEKARPIARRARAAAAAEAEARRRNRTPRRHQPRAPFKTGRRYLEDNQTQRSAETPRTRILGFRKPRAPIPAPDPRQSRPIRETEPSTRSDRQHDRQTHRPTEGNLTLPIGASAARSCWPAHPSSGLTSAAIEPNFFKPLPSSPSTLGSAATSCDGRARAAATAATATVASVNRFGFGSCQHLSSTK